MSTDQLYWIVDHEDATSSDHKPSDTTDDTVSSEIVSFGIFRLLLMRYSSRVSST